MNNVNVTKIASPPKSEDKTSIKLKVEIDGKPAMEVLNEIEAKMKSISKLAGAYDSGYGAPKDKTPEPEQNPADKDEKAVPAVPGTSKAEEGPGGYDVGYASPEAEEQMEEKICESCGSKYKATKKAEEEEDDDSDEDADKGKKMEKKSEEDEEIHPDKKMETSPSFGTKKGILKPSIEDITSAKSIHINMNELFNRSSRVRVDATRHAMNVWAQNEVMKSFIKK